MNTNSEATWFRSATFRTQGTSPGIDIGAEDGSNIATVHFDALTETREEVIARADLIVAAKGMYEALTYALEWIDAIPSDVPLPAMPGFDRDWVNEVIAKAQGAAK